MTETERLAQALDILPAEDLDGLTRMAAAALLRSQAAGIEALRAALVWYRDEAAALHRHMGNGVHTNAVLASVTVLALDAGARADAAIDAARQS